MAPDPKESNNHSTEDKGSKMPVETPIMRSLQPKESTGPGEIYKRLENSIIEIPKDEGDSRRWVYKWGAIVLLVTLLVTSGMAAWLIFQTARNGTPDGQKLAFGLIGSVLGVLWSHFTKLMETAAKR